MSENEFNLNSIPRTQFDKYEIHSGNWIWSWAFEFENSDNILKQALNSFSPRHLASANINSLAKSDYFKDFSSNSFENNENTIVENRS